MWFQNSHLSLYCIKSSICMANNDKDTKHTRHIDRIIHYVRNSNEYNIHKKLWCEGDLKLIDIVTKIVREDELNPGLEYDMVRLENLQNTCTRGVIGYIRV